MEATESKDLRIDNVMEWVKEEHAKGLTDTMSDAAEKVAQAHDKEFLEYVDSLPLSLYEKTRLVEYSTDSLALAYACVKCKRAELEEASMAFKVARRLAKKSLRKTRK